MKKYRILVSGIIAFAAIVFCQMISRAAEVVFVEGNVQVQSPQESVWRKVEQGMQVDIGDMIRTARNSRVDLVLDAQKKNTLRLDPMTQLVLNSAAVDTIDRIDLAKGRVYANLEGIKAGLSFEVNTPSAIAGVRGSALSVYVERDSDEVMALKDTVYIQAFDADKKQIADIMLPEGFKTYIDRFAEPSVFTQVLARDFDRSDRVFERISDRIEGRDRAPLKKDDDGDRGRDQDVEQHQDIDDAANVVKEISDVKEIVEDVNTIEQIDQFRADPYGGDQGGW